MGSGVPRRVVYRTARPGKAGQGLLDATSHSRNPRSPDTTIRAPAGGDGFGGAGVSGPGRDLRPPDPSRMCGPAAPSNHAAMGTPDDRPLNVQDFGRPASRLLLHPALATGRTRFRAPPSPARGEGANRRGFLEPASASGKGNARLTVPAATRSALVEPRADPASGGWARGNRRAWCGPIGGSRPKPGRSSGCPRRSSDGRSRPRKNGRGWRCGKSGGDAPCRAGRRP